ncbi:hypothetical protein ACWIGI_01935 [Nocardia sp. NPDC055321]
MRRRAWLVVAITVLALGLGAYSVRDLQPTYTNRIALTVGSPNRAPDQDAVLSVGYAQYFEDPAYQSELKAAKGVPDTVSLRARTVASSPILFIEATAATAETARDAAQRAGAAFRDEINASLRAAQDAAIAAVRKPFDDIRAANGVVNDVSLTQMQDQINRINADTSNKLIDLQLSSEVVRAEPLRWPTLLTHGVGGLLLGVLAALVTGALSRRVRTADDIEQKIGVAAIAVVPRDSRTTGAPRDRALRQVVTTVGLAAPVTRAAVACAAPEATAGVEIVARTIAAERARQGVRTILVHADLRRPRGIGVAELLAGRIGIDAVLTATPMPNLHEVFAGSTGEDPFTALSRERVDRLLAALHERADFVVIMAPPVLEAVETQVIAAAAGSTVLILDRAAARTGPARAAIRVLAAADATVLGAVLIDARDSGGADGSARPAERSAIAAGRPE